MKPTNIGFDYLFILTVIGIVASRHDKAEQWRKEQGMQYGAPQRQELNHLMLVKSIKRHFFTTPGFKSAMMGSEGDVLLANLKIDLLYNSPNQESKEIAIEVAKIFL